MKSMVAFIALAAGVSPAVGDVTVLITHAHRDHFLPELLSGTSWRVLAPDGLRPALPADRATTPTALAASGIRVTPAATSHAGVPHRSYRVEWHRRALYFTGDTEDVTPLLAQRGLDVAFVTPWLWKAVQGREASIDARQVVIYHHHAGEVVPGCTGTCRVPMQGSRWQH